MAADRGEVLSELPLPLGPDADLLDAVRIAVAIEDGCGVRIPEDRFTVGGLGRRQDVEALLAEIGDPG